MPSTPAPFDPTSSLASELSLPSAGVRAVLGLLGEGNTVPFVARYRKEATGGLDEVQIRDIQERHAYLKELHDRRGTILESIDQQGKLTDALRSKIAACTTKAALEDLYLPYKPKRRTKATIARERGLEPLADRILSQAPDGDPEAEAASFVDAEKEVPDVAAALAGARDIVAEATAEHAEARAAMRAMGEREGVLVSAVVPEKKDERTKFEQYYDFREALATIPSHRFLAVRRGEQEGVLRLAIEVDTDRATLALESFMGLRGESPWAALMRQAVADSYKRLLAPSIETDLRVEWKMKSDREAVDVFADNLRALLLTAPLGDQRVLGIDPGLRTGCKVAAIDETGKLLGHTVFSIVRGDDARSRKILMDAVTQWKPNAIAVGNGTGGRETESFVRKSLKDAGVTSIFVVPVNESGASIYSASDIAREEFPDLDLTVRGAISIARRLQDPLAELVKIDPKSIGVGQYQHDVHQPLLQRKLGEVVETCVNQVGVELNTASAPLLSQVAGIGPKLAHSIVASRETEGAFQDRKALGRVAGLGPRTFEQCAGFLRIRGGKHPLDSSAVHPERYALVESIAQDLGVDLASLVGSDQHAQRIDTKRYVTDEVGEPTLRDIVAELRKPGRDPRDAFEPPQFRDDVHTMNDLREGMQLQGVVTNVTAFGAFVDVGVHQDGLVHISQLADRYVEDPREVVRVGDKLSVRVMEVDLERKRIALSARSEPAEGGRGGRGGSSAPRAKESSAGRGRPSARPAKAAKPAPKKTEGHNNPLANLLKDFKPSE